MKKLFEYASEYAKGYADVGYDEDQIASVRDAFIDGAKWQKKHVWHTPDEEPKSNKEVLVEYKSGFHDAGYYAENEKIFYTGNELAKKDDITRWAYLEDLTRL